METPVKFQNLKCGLVNIQNEDDECFRWCMLYHQSQKKHNDQRISTLNKKIHLHMKELLILYHLMIFILLISFCFISLIKNNKLSSCTRYFLWKMEDRVWFKNFPLDFFWLRDAPVNTRKKI